MGRELGGLIAACLMAAVAWPAIAQPDAPAAEAEPSQTRLSIKGLGAGSTRFDAERFLGKIRCDTDRRNGRLMTCVSQRTTYAGFPAEVGFILADQAMLKVEVLGLKSGDFKTIAAALVAANGEPAERTTETMQNRMGASFTGEALVWTDAEGTRLIARQLGDRADEARVYLLVPDAETISKSIIDSGAERAAQDL